MDSAISNRKADLLSELREFLTKENYNGLELRLSPSAHIRAEAYLEASSFDENPELTPDGDGGIDIEWEQNDRRLILGVRSPSNDADSICWRDPGGRYEGGAASRELLSERLIWLQGFT